ncbi:hypothetical protein RchiOBHm_Chr2g0121721 [Rosa chinensis]|uniref:Uncharacterized protein n=1 Tax=Rosa chinensis TaxID=74649 RepID=A0A2P6RSK4_ROSCH|nr:hypothetical protein RchiOBHm_Chr2g0121721 [Rosa chinensis]
MHHTQIMGIFTTWVLLKLIFCIFSSSKLTVSCFQTSSTYNFGSGFCSLTLPIYHLNKSS